MDQKGLIAPKPLLCAFALLLTLACALETTTANAQAPAYVGQWAAQPAALAFANGKLYAAEGAAGPYTVVYSPSGQLLAEIATNSAYGVAVDPAGDIFTVDGLQSVFATSGASAHLWTYTVLDETEYELTLAAIAVNGAGKAYVLVNEHTAVTGYDRVVICSGNGTGSTGGDGGWTVGGAGSGIALTGGGICYVGDGQHDQIQVYAANGTLLNLWGSHGSGPGQFNGLAGLAVDGAGNVYAVDYGNKRVEIFNSAGAYVAEFGGAGSGPGALSNPQAVAVDPDGNVYVGDSNRIVKFGALTVPVHPMSWGAVKARYR